ncbi:hypothetical protein NSZ01_04500 [Nocardioides szechwanensis]|uniref:DUF4331 domain-containing protein n=1 Tax=Nocardioides szechwanensis TaxID=1005944 RepID=A0A1G9WC04_9ACTN|nr:DUF4331 domain-containing protein [Nocardioides szechwanensis]GEP32682.1 hypothetical protein NSZ01_04500 [Nocardioides szechwanensis]SDM81827.1 protein of unknown function [Nocardioides szechwanensis]
MSQSRLNQRRAGVALMAAGGLLATAGLAGLGPLSATASSHREAPLIAGLPQYDNTDLYAFRSPERPNTVTLAANWIPFEEPAGGPNFYSFATDARYDIHIDNDADAKPDVTFRWTFKDHYRSKNTFLYANGPVTSLDDTNLNFYQTYRLVRIKGKSTKVLVKSRKVAPSNIGEASMPDYAKLRNQATTNIGTNVQSFVGQAEDPFFLDLRVFDLLYGGDLSEVGDDTLDGFNVNSVALQVPRRWIAKNGNSQQNPVIGTWSTTSKKSVGGGYRQVSRLGSPLVNEVVLPLAVKDAFNASDPTQDVAALKYVTNPELPRLIEAVYGIKAPKTPRNDLVSVFLTGVEGVNKPKGKITPSEQLRLNLRTPITAEPNRLGVIGGDTQGFPNGRRLADDVVDIALQVVEGELVGNPNDLGDGVDANDVEFGDSFPYLALPVSGSEPDPHPTDPVNQPASAKGVTELLQNETVSASALGVGMLALLMGGAGFARRTRREN